MNRYTHSTDLQSTHTYISIDWPARLISYRVLSSIIFPLHPGLYTHKQTVGVPAALIYVCRYPILL